jgi:hypothetical protein
MRIIVNGVEVGIGAGSSDTIWDSKGDLAVGTGSDTAVALAIGTDNYVLRVATDTPAWEAEFDATSPSTQAFGDTATVGSAATASRRDHKHAMPASPLVRVVEAITTTNAILATESGSVFTNLGDADGATCTLPADAAAGTNFTFTLQAAAEFRVIVGKAASKFYAGGVISTDDGGNDLYISADDEGESITLCCDGANGWFPLAINGTWTVTQP